MKLRFHFFLPVSASWSTMSFMVPGAPFVPVIVFFAFPSVEYVNSYPVYPISGFNLSVWNLSTLSCDLWDSLKLFAITTTFELAMTLVPLSYFPLKTMPFLMDSNICSDIFGSVVRVMSNTNSFFSGLIAYATPFLFVLSKDCPLLVSIMYWVSHVFPWLPISSMTNKISLSPWIVISFMTACCHGFNVAFSYSSFKAFICMSERRAFAALSTACFET